MRHADQHAGSIEQEVVTDGSQGPGPMSKPVDDPARLQEHVPPRSCAPSSEVQNGTIHQQHQADCFWPPARVASKLRRPDKPITRPQQREPNALIHTGTRKTR